jgi:hypothetical protein
VRPNEPLRPEETRLIAPLEGFLLTEIMPKPLGFCLPTPGIPPTVRDENIVSRGSGR